MLEDNNYKDYSLNKTKKDITFRAKSFNMSIQEDVEELEAVLSNVHNKKETELIMRKTFYAEKIGVVIVYIEWVTYRLDPTSPYIKEGLKGETK